MWLLPVIAEKNVGLDLGHNMRVEAWGTSHPSAEQQCGEWEGGDGRGSG